MKKRILSILMLSFMIVSFVAPFLVSKEKARYNLPQETISIKSQLPLCSHPAIQISTDKIKNDNRENKEKENKKDAAFEEMNTKMQAINSIQDKKEWFLAYKAIIQDYSDTFDPPETIYDYYTEKELDMLFRVVQAEAGDEYSFEQKANVASVIINRLKHNEFGDNMFEVLTADQFETIQNKRYKKVKVSENTILACEYSFQIEDTTNGCLFFDSNHLLKYKFIFYDGAHNFYKLKEDVK